MLLSNQLRMLNPLGDAIRNLVVPKEILLI